MSASADHQAVVDRIERASSSPELQRLRRTVGELVGRQLKAAGVYLHVHGHILGTGRIDGSSPRGNGDDEVVAVGALIQVGGELAEAAVPLLAGAGHYAGAALLRQIVEVEYLMWAFAAKPTDAKAWLNSTKRERQDFFRPARLREQSGGRFNAADYSHHCEMGGHPVPRALTLVGGAKPTVVQMLLIDLLLHSWRTLDSLVEWSRTKPAVVEEVLKQVGPAGAALSAWSKVDDLYDLPAAPPPSE